MSDYGLIVRNSHKSIIIDSTYKNFTYYQSGTSTLSIGTNTIPISGTSDMMILVIQPSLDAYIAAYGFLDTTTPGIFESIVLIADAPCDCNWLLYKEGESHPTSDYGLKIKNLDDIIVFNSTEIGYANIIKRHLQGTYYTPGIGFYDPDINILNSNSYFQITGVQYKTICGSGIYTDYISALKKITSTSIRMGYIPLATGSSNSTTSNAIVRNRYILEFRPPPSL